MERALSLRVEMRARAGQVYEIHGAIYTKWSDLGFAEFEHLVAKRVAA